MCDATTFTASAALRRIAVSSLEQLLERMDTRGRHSWFLLLLGGGKGEPVARASLLGHVVHLLQDQVGRYWDTDDEYFDSAELLKLLHLVYQWPPQRADNRSGETGRAGGTKEKRDAESSQCVDVADQSDLICAALNLARFLIVRDAKKQRRFVMQLVREQYMKPLQKALAFSRRWYSARLGDDSGEAAPNQGDDFCVEVEGNPLQGLSKEDRKEKMQGAILRLDLVEFLLVRVDELLG